MLRVTGAFRNHEVNRLKPDMSVKKGESIQLPQMKIDGRSHQIVTFLSSKSVPNPFHVFEQNLLAGSIVEFRRSAVGMTGNSLDDRTTSRVPPFSR
jgi:hypothetical protein